MNGPARRLAVALFSGFAILVAAVTWFQVVGPDRYRDDPRNPRSAINLSAKERGLILAADGTVLARSVPDPSDPRRFVREYPLGPLFAQPVGYTSRLVGNAGLEMAFADTLRSRSDLTISDLIAALLGRDLRPLSIETTLDPGLQRAALDALDGRRGAVVALDPATGGILAYVSSPSYDPGRLLGTDAVDRRQGLLDDPDEPLRDRVTRERYAPGSTFKAVVAAAAFESGVAGPETEFPDRDAFELPGSTAVVHNYGGGRCVGGETVTLQTAFVRSCNTVFADLAIRVGADELGRIAGAMGFERDLDFPWEVARSVFPTRALVDDPAALGQSGLGERSVRATPLVMAMVSAAIANDGTLMEPYLVRRFLDADGEEVRTFDPRRLGRALSPASAAVLTQMMERVVTEGTGTRASVPGVRTAGKTGTTESAAGRPDVWFIGFAPVEAPTIALAVLVEDGGSAGETATGGSVAAPIAGRVIESWLGDG